MATNSYYGRSSLIAANKKSREQRSVQLVTYTPHLAGPAVE